MAKDEYFTQESPDGCTFVRIREDVLFYTAEYRIEVATKSRLGRWRVLFESNVVPQRPSRTEVIEWLHSTISKNPMTFYHYNIDFEALYEACGGKPEDLY